MDEVVSIHLHEGANSLFPTFGGLIGEVIRARGLDTRSGWRLTASPADLVPEPLDIAVMTGRSVTRYGWELNLRHKIWFDFS